MRRTIRVAGTVAVAAAAILLGAAGHAQADDGVRRQRAGGTGAVLDDEGRAAP